MDRGRAGEGGVAGELTAPRGCGEGAEDLEEGRYVTLEVADTGCGMSPEVLERVCEPFFTTKFTGRGLGLAVVQGIVRSHGGAIKFYSEPDRGTTIKLLFPALSVRAKDLVGGKSSAWRGEGLVLLVDDDEGVRSVATAMLDKLGFTVIEAHDGHQAVEIFRERREEITLVLMDLMMPRLSGEEAYREIRLLDKEVPVVLSSGYNESELGSRFAGKGVNGFIEKPYLLAALRNTLRKVFET